jgi:hypothetical protein
MMSTTQQELRQKEIEMKGVTKSHIEIQNEEEKLELQ